MDAPGGAGAMAAGGAGGSAGAGSGGAGSAGVAGASAGSGGAGGALGSSGSGGSVAMMPDDEDAGIASDAGEPASVLPMDGNALSVCESDDACNGDDLQCTVFADHRGYCAQDCGTDDDCAEIDGIAPSCDADGVCVIDCAGGGEGDGACPTNMICATIEPSAFEDPYYRCQYPDPENLGLYEVCDDDAQCKGELTCEVPGLTDLRASVCSASCMEASDCDDLGGAATPVCDPSPLSPLDGVCALECAEDGDCPGGMTCIAVDLLSSRCGHEL